MSVAQVRPSLELVSRFCEVERDETNRQLKAFHNFLPSPKSDKFVGACRSGTVDGTSEDYIEIYDIDPETYKISNVRSVCKGEDPRCFYFKGVPYAITWIMDFQGIAWNMDYRLINLLTGDVVVLDTSAIAHHCDPPKWVGKNWIPVERDGELYFIMSFHPINALKCDVETGKITCDNFQQYSVTEHRGGTPLIFSDVLNCYVGVGHRTYDGDTHAPYAYFVDKNLAEVKISDDLLTPGTNNIGVNDPLSLYVYNGQMYCCIGWAPGHIAGCSPFRGFLYKLHLEVVNK